MGAHSPQYPCRFPKQERHAAAWAGRGRPWDKLHRPGNALSDSGHLAWGAGGNTSGEDSESMYKYTKTHPLKVAVWAGQRREMGPDRGTALWALTEDQGAAELG